MKKIIALILAMTMVFAFAACGASAPEDTTATPEVENAPASGSDIPEVDYPASDSDMPVIDYPASDSDIDADMSEEDNQPATMPEEDNQPATMPEEDQVADDMPEVPAEDNTDDQPATMPEEDNQPADMPEVPEEDNSGDSAAMDEAVVNQLYAMVDSINAGVELPMVGSMALDAEMFPYYAFIEKTAGIEAVVSEAMIGSIAHSMVLYKCADGVDVAAIAAQIQANANPRKWVCVEAEKCAVVVKGSYILLVMSNTDTADALIANFNSL